jgi:hypothetical protein
VGGVCVCVGVGVGVGVGVCGCGCGCVCWGGGRCVQRAGKGAGGQRTCGVRPRFVHAHTPHAPPPSTRPPPQKHTNTQTHTHTHTNTHTWQHTTTGTRASTSGRHAWRRSTARRRSRPSSADCGTSPTQVCAQAWGLCARACVCVGGGGGDCRHWWCRPQLHSCRVRARRPRAWLWSRVPLASACVPSSSMHHPPPSQTHVRARAPQRPSMWTWSTRGGVRSCRARARGRPSASGACRSCCAATGALRARGCASLVLAARAAVLRSGCGSARRHHMLCTA